MALVHDMAECIVGDITPHDHISFTEKHQLEQVCHNVALSDYQWTSILQLSM